MNNHEVQNSADYKRICSLPRRDPDGAALAEQLTGVLRTPNGTMVLRPAQALALHDIGTVGGLTAPIRVGGGKTLVSLLAPHVLGSRRPLLLLPASLIGKTDIERRRLMQHWLIPRHIKVMSYESLGRSAAIKDLELYLPDLIIADEAHKLKNPRAACTKRVLRYMDAHPDTKMIVMSGSLIKHSLKDFATGCGWALKDGAPVPLDPGEVEDWANALDEKMQNPLNRLRPGVLGADVEQARRWFRDRFLQTPGVVGSAGTGFEGSLYIGNIQHDVNAVTERNFEVLRSTWCTPDGWAYSMATDIWRCARELALGLHYVWDPRPPEEWLEARKEWASWCRDRIEKSMWTEDPLDSELQVVNAVDSGVFTWCAEGAAILDEWRRIKPTFTINSKPVWHDDSAVNACIDWALKHKGIIWTEHTFFAHALERRGLPYYGSGGLDKTGKPIESEDGSRTIVASVASNGTGRNLQAFGENLITSLQPGADTNEQLIGRTHRDGQERDTVSVDILLSCAEHLDAMKKALADAQMLEQLTGQPQKLLLADLDWPEQISGPRTARWTRST